MAALYNDHRLLACSPKLNEFARALQYEREKVYVTLAPGQPRTEQSVAVANAQLCMLDRLDGEFGKLVYELHPGAFS